MISLGSEALLVITSPLLLLRVRADYELFILEARSSENPRKRSPRRMHHIASSFRTGALTHEDAEHAVIVQMPECAAGHASPR